MAIQHIAGGMTSAEVTTTINDNFDELSNSTLDDYAVTAQMIATGAITASKINTTDPDEAVTKATIGLGNVPNINISWGTSINDMQAQVEGSLFILYQA